MITNIAEIETSLGLEAGQLTEMITSDEEKELDLSAVVILPKTTYDTRIDNIKKETSTTTKEILIKGFRKELELEFEGKNEDAFLTAMRGKLEKVKEEAVTDPEKRYTDLKSDFEKLQGNLTKAEQRAQELENGFKAKETENEIKSEFFKHIPDNVIVSKNTIMTEAKEKGFSFVIEDGKKVVKDSSGTILKDEKTLSPLSYKEFAETFVTPYLPKVDGGSGKGNETDPPKAGSYEAFMKESEKNNWNATEMNEEMAKRITAGTLKI